MKLEKIESQSKERLQKTDGLLIFRNPRVESQSKEPLKKTDGLLIFRNQNRKAKTD